MELFFLLLLVVIMATALGSGFPVAFALPGSAVITVGLAALTGYLVTGNPDVYFHSSGPYQWLSAGVTNLRGVYWEVERDTLIAIPLFIFMGIMLQRSKIAEDLLVTMAQLFGRVPGGLGISVVFVGALLAATTGIVGATVVAMGLISLPAMLRNKYSPSLASGTIAASGTLGQIIPPSIVLIILADQLASASDQASTLRKTMYKDATGELSMPSIFDVTSTSAGEMFLGALVPGLVLVAFYMLYILAYGILNPKQAPSVGYEGRYDAAFWRNVLVALVPPLALIFMVLGSIITGVATVNQAGALGAAGALTMAGYRLTEGQPRRYHPAIMALVALIMLAFCLATFDMNVKNIQSDHDRLGIIIGAIATILLLVSLCWSGLRALRIQDTLRGVMLETAKTTSLVFIILLGAAMLTAAFRGFGGEELVRNFLTSLPGGFWVQFIIVMAVIFFLGFFLDFIEIAVVVVPIVAPILLADPSANITAVWLGVMIGLNIQTSFLTPPFGFALFYLRGVAPASVKTSAIYKGVVPFIMLQLGALAVVGLTPPLVNYLPNRSGLLADSAPPPQNPRLQVCLEEHVADYLTRDGGATKDVIGRLTQLSSQSLPKDFGAVLGAGLDDYAKAMTALQQADLAQLAVDEAAPAFQPIQSEVRALQKKIRRFEAENKEMSVEISRMRDPEGDAARKANLEAIIARNEAEIAALSAEIPDTWGQTYADFSKLLGAESKARMIYRRAADSAYENFVAAQATAASGPALDALAGDLRALASRLSDPAADLDPVLQDLSGKLSEIGGAGKVKSAMDKLRREVKAKTPKADKIDAAYKAVLDAFEAQRGLVVAVSGQVGTTLADALPVLANSIGARSQSKLTRDQALSLASCLSHHRDLSLHF